LGKYRPGAWNVQRMQQVYHAAAQTPLTEPPSQYRGDYPLARWQGGRLMDQADTWAQALPCPGRQPPGSLLQQLQIAAGRAQCAGHDPQQAGLAGPGWSYDGDPFACGDMQIHPPQGVDPITVLQTGAGQAQAHFSRSAARAASSMPL